MNRADTIPSTINRDSMRPGPFSRSANAHCQQLLVAAPRPGKRALGLSYTQRGVIYSPKTNTALTGLECEHGDSNCDASPRHWYTQLVPNTDEVLCKQRRKLDFTRYLIDLGVSPSAYRLSEGGLSDDGWSCGRLDDDRWSGDRLGDDELSSGGLLICW